MKISDLFENQAAIKVERSSGSDDPMRIFVSGNKITLRLNHIPTELSFKGTNGLLIDSYEAMSSLVNALQSMEAPPELVSNTLKDYRAEQEDEVTSILTEFHREHSPVIAAIETYFKGAIVARAHKLDQKNTDLLNTYQTKIDK